MKTIKELSDRQIKLAWISSKSLYEICKKLEIHDNTYNRKYLRVWGVKEGLKIPVFTRFTKTDYVKNPKLCKKCKKPIPWNQRENNFCSHSCATSYTNIKRGAITSGKYVKNATSKCLNCGKEIFARNKYCSIHLNTFGSTEDKQIFYKFLKEVNTESIRCNAKLDITIENASKPELWYRYPSNPNTFKECFKLFNLCFYRNVVKDSVDKIINWFKK